MFMLFLLCGIFADFLAPYGMNQISPSNRLQAAVMGLSVRNRQSRPRHAIALPLWRAALGDHRLLPPRHWPPSSPSPSESCTGYLGGKIDLVTQRFVDAWMSFPALIILIVVVSVVGPGMPQIIVTLGFLLGIAGSRIIRSAVVSVRENMYVHAAQSIGASTRRILWRHILPNIMPPIIVLFTTRVGAVILAEFEPVVPRPRRAATDADLGRDAVGQRPHLHVPGAVARAGAGPVLDGRCLCNQRVRRCLA